MCGICGIYDPHHKLTTSEMRDDISDMIQEFRYRGPDGQGTQFDEANGLGLGHVRLSIIDPEGGQQPMSNPDRTVWVTFNGEIYNFREQRAALEQTGYPFQTHCDTEVILALYQKYGSEAWERLRGQFAIGLWDSVRKSCFLIRDRIGEKPLVYSHHEGVLYFASELKGLLRSRKLPKKLDESALGLYLLSQDVPAPFSLVKGIRKLPPGYFLTADSNGVSLKPYWKPRPSFFAPINRKTAVHDFSERFEEAVQLCTVSDVPIGTYLSGGLDSTSVTAAVKSAHSENFHSFAIFNRENYEAHPDWKYAQEAAAFIGTQHHNIFYDLSELMRQIPEFIEKTDEPFEGPTALVSLFLAKHTRQYVKVVLTGNGGDELLGGYQSYYASVLKSQTVWQYVDRILPAALRSTLGFLLGKVHPGFQRLALTPEKRRVASTFHFQRDWVNLVCRDKLSETSDKLVEALTLQHSQEIPDYFKRYLWDDLFVFHHRSITTMADATGMACSLEARNPFLDYKLVEFLLGVPADLLIRRYHENKYLLLKAMETRIPASILYRKKEGFSGMTGEQITRYIRGEGRTLFRDTLFNSALAKEGFLPQAGLARLWEQYEAAPSIQKAIYYQIPIWSTVMLELWYRRHILHESITS